MLEVTAVKVIKQPTYQKLSCRIVLWGYDKLTPKSARAALQIAGYYTGDVYYYSTDKWGEYTYVKAYRVYPNSCRKIEDEVY